MATKRKTTTTTTGAGAVPPPKFAIASFRLTGNAPYVQNMFSNKAREEMKAKQEAGSTARKGAKREPKDFEAGYYGAMHLLEDGRHGMPATAFRQAMVSDCRIVGFKMTLAKLAVFIVADGIDKVDKSPLVAITKGKPSRIDSFVRNETGVADIRARPHFDAGWEVILRVRYDADMFTSSDVLNLMVRVGIQVGVGSGRPDSKNSCGQGWGTFDVEPIPNTVDATFEEAS